MKFIPYKALNFEQIVQSLKQRRKRGCVKVGYGLRIERGNGVALFIKYKEYTV